MSTCVNAYGPSPRAIEALRSIDPSVVRHHPFRAADALERIYALELGVEEKYLVATRGASDAIWQLAQLNVDQPVALPLPAYTEYVRAFPKLIRVPSVKPQHSIEQIADAAEKARVVIFSNPHNPSGHVLKSVDLMEVINAHLATTFVVDESYFDFVGNNNVSLIDSNAENVVVLRSPTKFFGLGGIRSGVVWSRSISLLDQLRSMRQTWPISMIDVTAVEAALSDFDWRHSSRTQLHDDGRWLEQWLLHFGDVQIHTSLMHFRLVTGAVKELVDHFEQRRVRVRRLEEVHGFSQATLRITAPTAAHRRLLTN